jgi:glutamyl-tRNA synthetase
MRVRFAPSPTGNLHIGSVRTALFNWLLARHNNGTFILRIEDTDRERSSKEFEADILEGMKWLGLNWDEGPFYQAEGIEKYRQKAQILLDKKLAYEKEGAIFFKVPLDGSVVIHDIVRGDVAFENKYLKDQVIIKSDGMATYNFAVVIDDSEMGITHVVRGEDHLPNTPKQILIYEALALPLPQFAHIPMILGTDRSKLSKRHGATSVNEYRKMGYLPEVMVNFLSMLGWTPADGAEIMSIEEIISKFSLDRVAKAGAIFDLVKLQWMNGLKLRAMGREELTDICLPYLPENNKPREWLVNVVSAVKDNLNVTGDITEASKVFFIDTVQYDQEKLNGIKLESQAVLALLRQKLGAAAVDGSADNAQKVIDEILAETGLSKKKVLHPIRYALTGFDAGPALKWVIALLGQESCLQRLASIG